MFCEKCKKEISYKFGRKIFDNKENKSMYICSMCLMVLKKKTISKDNLKMFETNEERRRLRGNRL